MPHQTQTDDPDHDADTNADMLGLLASRICHDLVSPVGAVANGLELLELAGMGGEELELIRESVNDASRRLKLFRLAFGAAPEGQTTRAAQLRDALAPGGQFGRLTLEWAPADMPRPAARRLCLGAMCLETALPYGGTLRVETGEAGTRLTARAERQRDCPELWAWLAPGGGAAMPAAGQLHFALLAEALARAGIDPALELGAEEIAFSV